VAEVLQKAGLATLLFDLLTPDEEEAERYTAYLRFNIALLTERLVQATDWLCKQDDLQHLAVGYFGASTGAAAALLAAVARPAIARAVVSRGGRPDLAMPKLSAVTAPTLFIVGGHDTEVLALNRVALDRLHCEKRLEIVPGATHLFEEPGTLEAAAGLARDWFVEHLADAHVVAARE
jgi:putative phosphoribosyl transferase